MLEKAQSFPLKLSLISRNKRKRVVLCFAINAPKACYLAVHERVEWHAKDDKKRMVTRLTPFVIRTI